MLPGCMDRLPPSSLEGTRFGRVSVASGRRTPATGAGARVSVASVGVRVSARRRPPRGALAGNVRVAGKPASWQEREARGRCCPWRPVRTPGTVAKWQSRRPKKHRCLGHRDLRPWASLPLAFSKWQSRPEPSAPLAPAPPGDLAGKDLGWQESHFPLPRTTQDNQSLQPGMTQAAGLLQGETPGATMLHRQAVFRREMLPSFSLLDKAGDDAL
jgi:hypothetical protein